jgi:acyl-CoA dehydrogenase
MTDTAGRSPRQRALDALPVLKANAARVDETASFPTASLDALRGTGLLGLLVPAAHGGLSGSVHDFVDVAGILGSGCLSTAMIWAMHSQQVDCLVRHGSERLREDLLGKVADGKVYIASVTTEPDGGGSLLSVRSSLRGSDGRVVVERQAPIVTGGDYADGFLVTMRDSEDASDNRVTLVYVDRERLRAETSGEWNPLGMRGTHSIGMRLSAEVPEHQIVGDRGDYRTVAVETMFPAAHLGWAGCWLGAARGALADVVALLRSPRRPKSLDPTSPLTAVRLARARADLELVGAYLGRVTDEVARHRADGRPLSDAHVQIHLNTLKVTAAELTFRAVDSLIQLTGVSVGYLRNSTVPLERHFRDLRSASLNYSNDRLLLANGALSLLDRTVRLA